MHRDWPRFLSAQSLPIIALISESLTPLVPWLAVRLPSRPPSGGLSEFSRFCGFVTNTSKAGGALVLSRAVAQPDPSVFSELLRKTSCCLVGIRSQGWRCGGGEVWLRWIGRLAMSEKYMSIGAPMTELPVAQPRGYTSHSHR